MDAAPIVPIGGAPAEPALPLRLAPSLRCHVLTPSRRPRLADVVECAVARRDRHAAAVDAQLVDVPVLCNDHVMTLYRIME